MRCRPTAITEEIEKCKERAKRFNAELVLVTNNQKVRDEMKHLISDSVECITL